MPTPIAVSYCKLTGYLTEPNRSDFGSGLVRLRPNDPDMRSEVRRPSAGKWPTLLSTSSLAENFPADLVHLHVSRSTARLNVPVSAAWSASCRPAPGGDLILNIELHKDQAPIRRNHMANAFRSSSERPRMDSVSTLPGSTAGVGITEATGAGNRAVDVTGQHRRSRESAAVAVNHRQSGSNRSRELRPTLAPPMDTCSDDRFIYSIANGRPAVLNATRQVDKKPFSDWKAALRVCGLNRNHFSSGSNHRRQML